MKKYTIKDFKEFCDNALVVPPMEEFDDGIIDEVEWYESHKIHIVIDNHDIELDYTADSVTEIGGALQEIYKMEMELEETHKFIFKTNLEKAFKTHMFMKDRDKHTVNELLYVLEHDDAFKGQDFNISIVSFNGDWLAIPTLEAFVNVNTRSMWFEDAKVEFEVEKFGEEQYNCITIYESEGV